ncbi:MAG TPA: hypothetical protein VHE09_02095 [Rhizomicrobium sp.]|nr:hypothetical protein [Rhizomicrobium sp.]
MTDETKQKRPAPISYRLPVDQADEIRQRIAASGLPVNAYITRAILNAPVPRGARRPPVEKQMLGKLLGRSGAIRDALDNASRVAGDDVRLAAAIEAAHDELTVIRAAILKMMEREL